VGRRRISRTELIRQSPITGLALVSETTQKTAFGELGCAVLGGYARTTLPNFQTFIASEPNEAIGEFAPGSRVQARCKKPCYGDYYDPIGSQPPRRQDYRTPAWWSDGSCGCPGGDNLIESVITRRSAEEMNLKLGDTVTAVIKSTEVMLQKD